MSRGDAASHVTNHDSGKDVMKDLDAVRLVVSWKHDKVTIVIVSQRGTHAIETPNAPPHAVPRPLFGVVSICLAGSYRTPIRAPTHIHSYPIRAEP
jgi:hypothetical protein